MKKILIYGFKPYKKYKKNISEEIVRKLKIKDRFRVKKVILPIEFRKDYILKEIRKYKPDFIIGLGQKGRGKLFEMERKAKNIFRKEKTKVKKIINPKGPREYFLNLKLKEKIPEVRYDYHSSDYLCNFSQYIIMDFINKRRLKTKFAFFHIPKDYPLKKGLKTLKKIILKIIE